ncbi:competence protein ComK [Cytobacillus spongiae]|jgi:competence protein ComK|uniref:competence protein ComK n=1 Tax=Cytobacillus spongiae TaxID=2901381 RepID=UPI001F48DBB6|nr:competence protein ComK [Cytobacillus spongiae]UII57638.1 competence protein ComK [Cytobacillus spongiae]
MIKTHYVINPSFMYMMGEYDRNGYECTLIRETERDLMISNTPLEVLDYSIRCMGFNLSGAMDTSRMIFGNGNKRPIMVNPRYHIVLFPTKSPKHKDNIWFNPFHIKRTFSQNGKTKALFSNGTSLIIPSRITSFNHKLLTADHLKNLTINTENMPFWLVLDPSERKKR